MDQILINNANQVMTIVPAGVALRSVTGAVGTLQLSSSESAADIIILSGVVVGIVIVQIATPSVPSQVVGTINQSGLAPGWTKIVRNASNGPLSISGPIGAPIVLAAGLSQMFISLDGLSILAANAPI